jgi:hypothetical protein
LYKKAFSCRGLRTRSFGVALFAASVLAAPVVLPHAAAAQIAGTGSIQGSVKDSTGAAIPGATVTLKEQNTGTTRTVTSSSDGLYSLPNVNIGTYSLTVASTGFQTYTQKDIVLEVGSSIGVNVPMTVGSESEKVTVTADALALQTEDTSFKQTIDQRSVTELPLNGRQVTSLITLSGASVPSNNLTQGNKGFYSSVSPNIAGGQGNQVDFRLDGGDNNDYMSNTSFAFPFPDAIAQFSVETGPLSAQSGLHPAGRINAVTRSGTNSFHGTVFDFIRNNYINATNYFSTSKDTLHQNQYGGTIGGPVLKNKLFFFAGYQRLSSSASSSATTVFVPTAANLAGDFSVTDSSACGTAIQLLNPRTGAVLPNNRISPSFFNASALALTKYLPTPSNACGQYNLAIPILQTENQFITRIDANLSAKHTLYGRYFYDGYNTPAFFSPTNILLTNNPGNNELAQSLTIGENWIASSKLVNSLHLTATRRQNTRGPAGDGINASALGINIYQPYDIGLRISAGRFNTYCSTCAPGIFNVNSFSVIDDVNLVLGKHQIVFGGEFIRAQENINNAFSSNGNFTFNGTFSQRGPAGTSTGGTGADGMLDFLTGSLSQFSQSKAQQNALRAPIPGLYIQDTYHVNSQLVITAGIRWGGQFWPTDYFHRGTVFSQSAFAAGTHSAVYPNAPAGTLFYGDTGVPSNLTANKPWQFSPRLGFTFDPTGNGNTVFRVGGSMIYDETNFFAASQPNYNPPFSTLVTNNPQGAPIDFTNPWASGTTQGNPFPMSFTPSRNTTFSPQTQYVVYGPNFQSPYVVSWTASMQHLLGHGWSMQVNYIGNKTTHQPYGYALNPAVYIPGTWRGAGTCGPLTVAPSGGVGQPCSSTGNATSRYRLTLANPAQGNFYAGGGSGSSTTAMISGSNASYNGVVFTLEHRLSNSFSLLANHTWSHCIALLDNPGSFNSTAVQNPDNIKADYANCGFDRRNIFNASIVAESNFPLKGYTGYLVNHWQISPIFRATSGAPFNVTSGIDNSLTSIGNDRPNLSPAVANVYTGNHPSPNAALNLPYIVPTAFSQNALGTYGNLGRNHFVGPKLVNLDAALSRKFPIRESLDLQLRLEAFNVLNHPNFNNPSTTAINSSAFGKITTAQAARIFQGAVKINF